jgi:fluoroquinolone transport system permease protein
MRSAVAVIRLRCQALRELAATGTLPRTVRWQPVLIGWILAAAVLAWKAREVSTVAGRVTLLRVVAVLLVVGAVNLVDDAAANLLASAPLPLAWRRGTRLTLAAVAVAVPWSAALLWLRPGPAAAAVALECAALTAFGLAVAAGVARWSEAREAGLAAGPAVVASAAAAAALPSRWAMFPLPDGAWRDAHLRWAVVLAAALTVLLVTLRDPAAGRRPL